MLKREGGGRGKFRAMSYVPQPPTLTRFRRRKPGYRRVIREGAANEQRRRRDGRHGSSDAVPLFAFASFRRVPVPGVAALQDSGSRAIGLEHAIYLGETRSEENQMYPKGEQIKEILINSERNTGGGGSRGMCANACNGCKTDVNEPLTASSPRHGLPVPAAASSAEESQSTICFEKTVGVHLQH